METNLKLEQANEPNEKIKYRSIHTYNCFEEEKFPSLVKQ